MNRSERPSSHHAHSRGRLATGPRAAIAVAWLSVLGGCAGAYIPDEAPLGPAESAPAGAQGPKGGELSSELETARQELGLALRHPEAVEPLGTGGQGEPDCSAAPALRDRICALAQRICDIAERDPDPQAVSRCGEARNACQQAKRDVASVCGP